MKTVVVFDFDGTLTRKDTMLEFIKFTHGKAKFLFGFLLYTPWLLAYKFRLYPNWKIKQKILSHFFAGMPLIEFESFCRAFFRSSHARLLYKRGEEQVREYLQIGHEVVIISASVENWVKPFAEYLGVRQVLGTQMEVDEEGRLTGFLATPNCYGQEKVNRLLALFPDRDAYRLIAYGDSSGDREILDYADKAYFREFNDA